MTGKDSGIRTIGIVGGGAWGTALGLAMARAGLDVALWAREPEVAASVASSRENTPFLPGHRWPQNMKPVGELKDLTNSDALLLAVPAQAIRALATALRPVLPLYTPVLICAKGMERHSGLLMNEVAMQELPGNPIGLLSGPSFAADVAKGMPTAITLAMPDLNMSQKLVAAIGSATLRPYASDDPTGVAVGGAVKNVLAIACGIVAGRGLGDSARAALTARGFAEMVRFGGALGARPETLTGLSGLGDLILTCNSTQSRNFQLGLGLAQGRVTLGADHPLAEGAETAGALVERAHTMDVDMPIAGAVSGILERQLTVDTAIQQLLARPLKQEH